MEKFDDENKFFKEAKEWWNKYKDVLKMMYGIHNFDEYYLKIKDQNNMRLSMPPGEQEKFINAQIVMTEKYAREMKRTLNKNYGKKS